MRMVEFCSWRRPRCCDGCGSKRNEVPGDGRRVSEGVINEGVVCCDLKKEW